MVVTGVDGASVAGVGGCVDSGVDRVDVQVGMIQLHAGVDDHDRDRGITLRDVPRLRPVHVHVRIAPGVVDAPQAREDRVIRPRLRGVAREDHLGLGEPDLRAHGQRVGGGKHLEAVGRVASKAIHTFHAGPVDVNDPAGAGPGEDGLGPGGTDVPVEADEDVARHDDGTSVLTDEDG